MRMSRAGIEPFYFGTSAKPLFGCYHAPQSRSHRESSVVLCYPMGGEYIRSHRSYQQLAVRLSNVGFPILRFDFYGCGDSGGDCAQGQVQQWLLDIAAAVGEIRHRCGIAKVCLVGRRLGATLAAMAAETQGDIDSLILWEPIVQGKAYLEELLTLHQDMLRYSDAKPKRISTDEQPVEALGFPLTTLLRTELEHLNLLGLQQQLAHRILVIEDHVKAGASLLSQHLLRSGAHVTCQYLPSHTHWTESVYNTPVPVQILQAVVSWMVEVYP
jgi:uncharacterized protein